MNAAITLDNVSKTYGDVKALKKASFDVQKGEVFGIVGPSGAGKSTLLRLIDLLEEPSGGKILIDGKMAAASGQRSGALRRSIGMVLQKPVVLNRSVAHNLAYPLQIRGMEEEETAALVEKELKRLGLQERSGTNARTLSGGETQRLCFARATIYNPSILLLDEFAANLDPTNVALLENQVRQYIQGVSGRTVVIVTHNMFQAKRMCTKVALLWDGVVVELSDKKKFFENPDDPRTAAFVSGESVY